MTRTLEARTPGEERVAARRGDIWGEWKGKGEGGGRGEGAGVLLQLARWRSSAGRGRDMFGRGIVYTVIEVRESEYSNGRRTGVRSLCAAKGGSRT